MLALTPATECHLDGYYPLGTDNCVMVVKDEHDRILITHEAASENGDDARQFLQRCKDRGLKVTAAFSDYSPSFTEAIKAVYLRIPVIPATQSGRKLHPIGPPSERSDAWVDRVTLRARRFSGAHAVYASNLL